jgi:hypothetical protein
MKCPNQLEIPMVFIKQFRDVRDGDFKPIVPGGIIALAGSITFT